MNDRYFNSIENEWYYFPDIQKERNRYIKDKKNFDNITDILDTLEFDFQKEKDENKQRFHVKSREIDNMMQEEMDLLDIKKNKYVELLSQIHSIEYDTKNSIQDNNDRIKTNDGNKDIRFAFPHLSPRPLIVP